MKINTHGIVAVFLSTPKKTHGKGKGDNLQVWWWRTENISRKRANRMEKEHMHVAQCTCKLLSCANVSLTMFYRFRVLSHSFCVKNYVFKCSLTSNKSGRAPYNDTNARALNEFIHTSIFFSWLLQYAFRLLFRIENWILNRIRALS